MHNLIRSHICEDIKLFMKFVFSILYFQNLDPITIEINRFLALVSISFIRIIVFFFSFFFFIYLFILKKILKIYYYYFFNCFYLFIFIYMHFFYLFRCKNFSLSFLSWGTFLAALSFMGMSCHRPFLSIP